jgi:microcystin-dependent protein
MADAFIGEIRIFAGNFAPKGWALCNGQLMPLSQNTALFSLLGVTYGGDGKVTFALPNLQGRAPMQPGQGPGLTPRTLGETNGSQMVTLLPPQMPAHNHIPMADDTRNSAKVEEPTGHAWGSGLRGTDIYTTEKSRTTMSPAALGAAGGSQPHNNMQPYLGVNFIIALQGDFPQRP